MRLMKISFLKDEEDGNGPVTIRNWINVDTIQSITDGDAPKSYRSIISYPDHKMFFDVRTPEELIEDIRMNQRIREGN